MKHALRFSLLSLLAMMFGYVQAAEVKIDFNAMNVPTSSNEVGDGDINETWTYTLDGVTINVSPKDENASNPNRFWGTNNGPQLRCYSGTITISATESISKIEFAKNGNNFNLTPSVGTLDGTTWTGDAQSVVFSVAKNTQLNSITVTTGGSSIEPPSSDIESVANIAAFKALEQGSEAKLTLTNAQVVYATSTDIFVRDNSGAIDFYQTGLEYAQNQILNGTITGKLSVFRSMPELTKGDNFSTAITTTEGSAAVPEVVPVDEVGKAYECDLITIKNLTITVDGNNVYGEDDGARIQIYDKFRIGYNAEEGKTYDITGILIPYNDSFELAPTIDFTNGETPTPPVQEKVTFKKATSIESGKQYIIAANVDGVMKVAQPISKNYGYLYVEDATDINGTIELDNADNAFTVTATDNGYTFLQQDGRYLYQTGTYNSFNVTAEPTEGQFWTIVTNDDGTATITNTNVNKFIQYSVGFKSYGSYAETQDNAVLPSLYVKADDSEEVTALWDFQHMIPASLKDVSIEGTTGEVASTVEGINLFVDATGGKLKARDSDAQFNANTIIRVPVVGSNDIVTVVSYPGYHNFTVGGTAADADETIYQATATDAKLGYAEIVSTGSSYLYSIQVEQKGKTNDETTPATWQDIELNLTGSLVNNDEKVEGTNIKFGVIVYENGAQQRVDADDPSANIVVDGTWHDDSHGWTKTTATVKVNGAVKIGIGNCQYGSATVSVKNAAGEEVVTFPVPSESNCWHQDRANNITYGTYNGEATTLTIYNATYMPFISVQAIKTDLENEEITATFPFDLGTADQKANFGEAEEFFLSSKVEIGSNLNYYGSRAHANVTLTQLNPTEQQSAADESNAIKFIIRPYPGLTFTPTKVSLKANRWGTDGGKIDIAWLNPNGQTLTLAEGETPNRNNSEAPSEYTFTLTDATPGEGECGLQVNLYNLANNKQYGFADIVIEGVLNGKKQEIPILSSFVANGIKYDVEKTFAISGDDYVAEIELSKKETMISAQNPISEVVAKEGNIGTITYDGDATHCTVAIPVTHNNITMKWVANFAQKPDYTLTYFDADGTTILGTQTIEKDAPIESFDVDATKVTVAEGNAFRGWAAALSGSGNRKYKIGDSFTENTKLYALVTRIETATATARYDYDFTDEYFDPADHEMLTSIGNGYWHDKQHGWAFSGGDQLKLTMAGKGYIKLGLCQYSTSADITLTSADGTTIATINGKASTDGASTTLQYDGAQGAGDLTLTFPSGATYIHNLSIVNLAETPYEQIEGSNYVVVKRGATDTESGNNLLTALELANGFQGSERYVLFLPNGTYDLGETVLTPISRNNLSLVGQSMEGVVIVNAPDRSIEGIGTTATILNTSSNLYLQDLTLKNDLDYYGAGAAGQVGGRAVCLQDKGKNTIAKNVRMLSYQDTYYSNSNSQFYWETSELHGCVDFLCGGGDVYYNQCLLVAESRSASSKSGEATLTAPYIDASNKFGYVFEGCTIENKAAKFNFGRAWGGVSRLAFLNTTLNQPNEIAATRFTTGGMNVAADKFVEYRSVDSQGNIVSPETNILTFTKDKDANTYETILTADQAAEYAIDKVFTNWRPEQQTVQTVMSNTTLDGDNLKWPAVDGANAYAVFCDADFIAITTDTSIALNRAGNYTVRAANAMGGFGEASNVSTDIQSVEQTDGEVVRTVYYTADGTQVTNAAHGLLIRVQTLQSGKKIVSKIMK